MKGDFSHWDLDPRNNVIGVLQQQGRVLLDRDWNDQTRLTTHWEDQAGRDIIGPDVAAVPSGGPDGFAVVAAAVATGPDGIDRVEVQLTPGRVWADGIVCYLPGVPPDPTAPVMRVADYLQPPIQVPAGTVASIADGVRDAVILEVSREALNAFQVPDDLLEPALGGPDTTERIQTRAALGLFRLGPGEDCKSILDALQDDPESKGRLTVQLQPTVVIPGDCPVVLGGGYTGFEHFLFRVEIAALNAGSTAHFKWSQFNGGLVGRGELIATPNRIRITGNRAAIVNSGLNAFYCEVVTFDAQRGVWNVTYGAEVTLVDGELHVGTERLGVFSAATDTVFFRLWNGIAAVSEFTNAATPVELLDGIQLLFDAPAASNYVAGDYWTFTVRAGEIQNSAILIADEPPHGPRYHRVSLAEITWGPSLNTGTSGEIEDCREKFRPLTQLDTCCTYRVGDGHHSHGDFTSVQAAINALPARGGEVCVLPGVYEESVVIQNRSNVTISGCGTRSLIRARPPREEFGTSAPAIHVRGGVGITIESLAVEGNATGAAIVLEGASYIARSSNIRGPLRDVMLSELLVLGGIQAAVLARFVEGLTIRRCCLHQRDQACQERTLVVRGDAINIVENLVEVGARSGDLQGVAGGAWSTLPYFGPGSIAMGGIHVEGMSERIRICRNIIRGGSSHGITLGSLLRYDDTNEPVPDDDTPDDEPTDPCAPTRDVPGIVVLPVDVAGRPRVRPDGPIEDLLIAKNRILDMGTCGISVLGFFDLRSVDAFISVRGLTILGNEIRRNMRRAVAELPAPLANVAGFGGIALADVEHLDIRDNLISENGASHLETICGVFVLHGEGVQIERNRILNNGRKNGPSSEGAKNGRRGGIVLVYASAPTRLIQVRGSNGNEVMAPAQDGVPAARIHDNIVSQPLGQALLMNAVGPVSVVANQLTSQGLARGFTTSFIASTVSIMNLGLSNEFYLQYFAFLSAGAPSLASGAGAQARPGIDDFRLGRALASGTVLFDDNQVTMDVFEAGRTLALSSILIITLDDLGFCDNQCVANTADDFILSQALLFGMSVRVGSNRFTEGLLNALLSAVTLGLLMNTTTHNQATHCILASGNRLVRYPNTTFIGGVELGDNEESRCQRTRRLIEAALAAIATGSAKAPPATTQPANGNLITGAAIHS